MGFEQRYSEARQNTHINGKKELHRGNEIDHETPPETALTCHRTLVLAGSFSLKSGVLTSPIQGLSV